MEDSHIVNCMACPSRHDQDGCCLDVTGEWTRPFDIPEPSHDYPGQDWPEVAEQAKLTANTLLFIGADEIIRLRGVIERIQKHAYDGDMVFVICREELGHE